MKAIEPQLLEVIKDQPYPLLFVTVSGAHLYGFASGDSDYDLRGVHILPAAEVMSLYPLPETIEQEQHPKAEGIDLDLVTHDVKKFMGLMLKKNGYVLEQLHSPLILHTTDEHQQLKELAKRCVTRFHAYHYLGFSRTQWELFRKDQQPRVKPLLYVYRVLLTGIHLMETGEIEANLVTLNEKYRLSHIDDLVQQKIEGAEKGLLEDSDLEFHQKEYERLTAELERASEKSFLPEAATVKGDLNELLLRARGI